MNVLSLDIPDDPAAVPAWLEQHLLGFDLGVLVEELAAVHAEEGPSPGLDELLGAGRERVLHEGLATLSADAIRALLRHPRLLLDLQELVLSAGGSHWDRQDGSQSTAIAQAWQSLAARVMPPRISRRRRTWVAGLISAAAVLLAVLAYDLFLRPTPAPAAWGWAKPGAFPQHVSASAYFTNLADGAEDWFKKRPETPTDLARRLTEFRQGCALLLLSDHQPLAPADRAWLLERCRAWSGQLDQHLRDLENGQPTAEVRAQVDQLVRRLSQALRARATIAA